MVDSHKGQDKHFVEEQWKKEQERIKREEAQQIQRKMNAVEMAKESMQKAQIRRTQNMVVKDAENNAIRDQLK